MSNKTNSFNSTVLTLALGALVVGFMLLMPDIAMAASWEAAPKQLYDRLMGTFFGNLAALAIVALAILSLAGKIDWRWGVSIIVAIVVAFSAPTIVDMVKSWVT